MPRRVADRSADHEPSILNSTQCRPKLNRQAPPRRVVDRSADREPSILDPANHKKTHLLLAKRGLRIGRTSVGKGLFATRRFVDGSCIGEIQGEIIFDDDYCSRYAFDLSGGAQLEPHPPFRFVNHSCEPNCAFESFTFPPQELGLTTASPAIYRSTALASEQANKKDFSAPVRRQLLLFSISDIAIGQELTIDYNWPAIFAIPCACRAAQCRGWIVSSGELAQVTAGR